MEFNCFRKTPKTLHLSLKDNQKNRNNFQIPQNKVEMRFYGKFAQDHEICIHFAIRGREIEDNGLS